MGNINEINLSKSLCKDNISFSLCLFLDAALHQLQVYIWESESCSASSVSKQLPSFTSPCHTCLLSGITYGLPHSQPLVHDAAQVRKDDSMLQYIHTFTNIDLMDHGNCAS